MAKNDQSKNIKCSFCGKTQDIAERIIAGPGVYICDECVEICAEIMEEEFEDICSDTEINLLKPREIKEFLDEYVIGQDEAKKALAVAYLWIRVWMWNYRRVILLW